MTTQTKETGTVTKSIIFTQSNDLGLANLLHNKDFVRRNVYFKIVNPTTYQRPLDKIPHEVMLGGFLKVFYIFLEADEEGVGGIVIDNTLMDYLHLSLEELSALADKNTPLIFKPRIYEMGAMIQELIGTFDEMPPLDELPNGEMFVLTNTIKVNGASAMFYENLLEHIASTLNSSFFILPSSIHEVILLKDHGNIPPQFLKEMVQTVNVSEVPDDEILSDSVFYYSQKTNTLSVVA